MIISKVFETFAVSLILLILSSVITSVGNVQNEIAQWFHILIMLVHLLSILLLTLLAAFAACSSKIEMTKSQRTWLIIFMLASTLFAGFVFIAFCKINNINYKTL